MRHWIIGNGPSINKTPLHLLKDEITWGMNRPPVAVTNYFCMDVNPLDTGWKEAIQGNLKSENVYLWDGFKEDFNAPNIIWLSRCIKKMHHFYAADNVDKRAESWHLPEVCTAFGSMYPVLQLAVLNGATEIYLVGCDMFTGQGDHYSTTYPENVAWTERNMIENHIHSVSKRSCPVPIINCSIGGGLGIYPRKNIEEVLNG